MPPVGDGGERANNGAIGENCAGYLSGGNRDSAGGDTGCARLSAWLGASSHCDLGTWGPKIPVTLQNRCIMMALADPLLALEPTWGGLER